MTKINSLDDIVKNGLCIGCGLCKSIAGNSIEMEMSDKGNFCLLYTSPSPRDAHESRMPSSA